MSTEAGRLAVQSLLFVLLTNR